MSALSVYQEKMHEYNMTHDQEEVVRVVHENLPGEVSSPVTNITININIGDTSNLDEEKIANLTSGIAKEVQNNINKAPVQQNVPELKDEEVVQTKTLLDC